MQPLLSTPDVLADGSVVVHSFVMQPSSDYLVCEGHALLDRQVSRNRQRATKTRKNDDTRGIITHITLLKHEAFIGVDTAIVIRRLLCLGPPRPLGP